MSLSNQNKKKILAIIIGAVIVVGSGATFTILYLLNKNSPTNGNGEANHAPTNPQISVTPESVYTHETIFCTITNESYDADGDIITYFYEWFKNGTSTGITQSYLTPGNTTIREEWTCVVKAFDGFENSTGVNDSAIVNPYTPSGTYTLSPPISYQCGWFIAMYMVELFYTQFTFVDNGITLRIEPMMNGLVYMTGPSAENGVIDVTGISPGSCTEQYSLTGTFTNSTIWVGTFSAFFTGSCLDCPPIVSWSISGTLL